MWSAAQHKQHPTSALPTNLLSGHAMKRKARATVDRDDRALNSGTEKGHDLRNRSALHPPKLFQATEQLRDKGTGVRYSKVSGIISGGSAGRFMAQLRKQEAELAARSAQLVVELLQCEGRPTLKGRLWGLKPLFS